MKKKEILNIDRTSGIFFLERFAPGVHWHNDTHGTWLSKRDANESACSRRFEFTGEGIESTCIEPDCRHYGERMGCTPYALLHHFMDYMKKCESPDWNPPQVAYVEYI